MAIVKINGETFTGNNVTLKDNIIIIDGKVIKDGKSTGTVNITINGDVEKINVDYCNNLKVSGNVGIVSNQSGDTIISGDVTFGVYSASGDVECGKVYGEVSTKSGDIIQK